MFAGRSGSTSQTTAVTATKHEICSAYLILTLQDTKAAYRFAPVISKKRKKEILIQMLTGVHSLLLIMYFQWGGVFMQ